MVFDFFIFLIIVSCVVKLNTVFFKIKLKIIEPEKEIDLLFVEDLCRQLNDLMNKKFAGDFVKFKNVKKISVGELASTIKTFQNYNSNIKLSNSKDFLKKNLYKTFISFL